MVRPRLSRSFLRDEFGTSLAEGLIVLPLVVLVFAAFVEFGYAMFQWNQTVKAAQYGARLVAVSDPVATGFVPIAAATPASATSVGAAIPIGATWACGADTGTACNNELNRIVYGSTGSTVCQPVGAAGRPAMCHLNSRLRLANVRVTYEMSGLGYYGRPEGAVVTICVEVRNITFDLPILGGLLGIDTITIPRMPVTVTSEDLDTTSGS